MSHSVPVTSTETILTTIAPPPEPRVALDMAERAMVATSALLQNLLCDPDFSPKTRERWGTLMQQYHDELQSAALHLFQVNSMMGSGGQA